MRNLGAWKRKEFNSRWLPWVVGGVILVVLSIVTLIFRPIGLELSSSWVQAALWGFLIIETGFLIFLLIERKSRFSSEQARLKQQIKQANQVATAANQRLEAVFRLSQKFVEATDEQEVVELLLRLSVDSVRALGASLVPLDERGQPMAAVNYGELPAPVFTDWIEYLASPAVRQRCETCQNHGALTSTCPLLQGPVPEAVDLYCLPLRRGDREFGVMNLYLPKDYTLDEDAQTFLHTMIDETVMALEGMRLLKRELAALRQLQTVQRRTDLSGMLSNLVEDVRETLKADFVRIILSEPEANQPPLTLTAGEFSSQARLFIEGLLQGVLTSGEPILLGRVEGDRQSAQKLAALMVVPLVPQDGPTQGVILAGNIRQKSFNQRQLTLLNTVASQVALVVHNARLMAELEYKSMMAERTRLAREIHDGLAQTLGFLKLQTAQMQNYLTRGEVERLERTLRTSYDTLTEAYLDARQAIDGLRITPTEEGLAGWLEQTVAEFNENSGLEVELIDVHNTDHLASEIQAQLIRIVQEALNNVRKHAQPSRSWISCRTDGSDLLVEVRDNGKGFSPEDVPAASRYGLQGMRERSELIGADFQIISQPNQGTTVRLRLPLVVEEERV